MRSLKLGLLTLYLVTMCAFLFIARPCSAEPPTVIEAFKKIIPHRIVPLPEPATIIGLSLGAAALVAKKFFKK